jgi:hypothetical protein
MLRAMNHPDMQPALPVGGAPKEPTPGGCGRAALGSGPVHCTCHLAGVRRGTPCSGRGHLIRACQPIALCVGLVNACCSGVREHMPGMYCAGTRILRGVQPSPAAPQHAGWPCGCSVCTPSKLGVPSGAPSSVSHHAAHASCAVAAQEPSASWRTCACQWQAPASMPGAAAMTRGFPCSS